jgi:hypothetical protein
MAEHAWMENVMSKVNKILRRILSDGEWHTLSISMVARQTKNGEAVYSWSVYDSNGKKRMWKGGSDG